MLTKNGKTPGMNVKFPKVYILKGVTHDKGIDTQVREFIQTDKLTDQHLEIPFKELVQFLSSSHYTGNLDSLPSGIVDKIKNINTTARLETMLAACNDNFFQFYKKYIYDICYNLNCKNKLTYQILYTIEKKFGISVNKSRKYLELLDINADTRNQIDTILNNN